MYRFRAIHNYGITSVVPFLFARMAEQEDAWDLKSQEEISEGSIPSVSTDRSMV